MSVENATAEMPNYVVLGKVTIPEDKQNWLKWVNAEGEVCAKEQVKLSPEEKARREAERKKAKEEARLEREANRKAERMAKQAERRALIKRKADLRSAISMQRKKARKTLDPRDAEKLQRLQEDYEELMKE